MKKKGAFTLVELLAVIVIIAFMVAILLPALRSARKKADSLACASNLRQIGTAIATYCSDHEGYYPHIPAWPSGELPSAYSWWSVLAGRGYLSRETACDARVEFLDLQEEPKIYPTRVFLCRSQPVVDTHPTWGPRTAMQPATCYGMNVLLDSWIVHPGGVTLADGLGTKDPADLCAYFQRGRFNGYGTSSKPDEEDNLGQGALKAGVVLPNGSRVYLPVKESTVQQSSEKFLVADTRYRRAAAWYRNWGGALFHNMNHAFMTPFYGHPGRRCNVLFCDYHVGSVRSTDHGVCIIRPIKGGPHKAIAPAKSINRSVPGVLGTCQKFYHWSPFAFRRNWDPDEWPELLKCKQ